ncbi:MerR family transcriptional regulator [uncultured Brevundimonas sp.]|uniref:MerR family transcriptional regulator n=1 Tax=uncultured Brevundimonas sp. TaxID=213418 RepID=UPI0026096436|nr:MerR family transcriptional regulator [uncultured Brevundimonas sp.]
MSKSPNAFRSISEAAEEVGVPQHVLRFWEGKLDFIQPVKRAGGRRFYRPEDIRILQDVRRLLHDEGMTIKGVERLYKDSKGKLVGPAAAVSAAPEAAHTPVAVSSSVRTELTALLGRIEAAQQRLAQALGK